MTHSQGIFWLSSYPKSGNTWFRIFLANLLNLSGLIKADSFEEPMNINHVDYLINDNISTNRTWVNQACGFNTSWLTDDELDALMPSLFSWQSAQQTDVTYHKIHRAYTYVDDNKPLIPLKGCLGAIYFIRNPLDIAISFANHLSCTIDEVINIMGDRTYALYHYPLRQLLFSWSMHVNSWVNAKGCNHFILRYEDMITNPVESFTNAVKFLNLDVSASIIEQAISGASFDKLQQFEKKVGFMDKPPKLSNFFRKGVAGDWQTTLTADQIQRIIHDHGDVMRTFGYLNEHYEPIIE
ncbi:MAG: sulfotransferase domain-containing protein [Legionella sp.]|nr:sulfotransferase domain-containing protein [Legionella sp.]